LGNGDYPPFFVAQNPSDSHSGFARDKLQSPCNSHSDVELDESEALQTCQDNLSKLAAPRRMRTSQAPILQAMRKMWVMVEAWLERTEYLLTIGSYYTTNLAIEYRKVTERLLL
jgi:hypothetical protein